MLHDKPETIEVLKDNIREIQLEIIGNVLKNWSDRVGYCMASRVSHLNEIFQKKISGGPCIIPLKMF